MCIRDRTIAEELGLVENKDFFLIRYACHTELEPEEFDENGEGMTPVSYTHLDLW